MCPQLDGKTGVTCNLGAGNMFQPLVLSKSSFLLVQGRMQYVFPLPIPSGYYSMRGGAFAPPLARGPPASLPHDCTPPP